jgi:magnesium transporter
MTKDFSSFLPDTEIGEVIRALKERGLDEETSHYVYLTDENDHLTGVVTLLDIAASARNARLGDLMTDHLVSVHDEDRLDLVMDLMQKYNLQMMPVIDENEILVGIILLNDLIHEYIKLRRIPA